MNYRIADICKIKSGKRIPKGFDISLEKTDYRYIRARDIKHGKIDSSDLAYITGQVREKIKKYIVNTGDIVITIAGTIGEIAYVPSEFDGVNLTENAVRLTDFDDGVNPKYLSYVLSTKSYWDKMQALSAAAAQPKLGIYKLESIEVELPAIEIQTRIADILSAYDNLIENNQKQIKLLEEAAQRLYKEWFVNLRFPGYETVPVVDGVPKGWKQCVLGDVISFNPKVSLNKECIKQSIPMSALSTNSMVLNENQFETTTSNSGSKFQNDDTLLARITPCLENGKTAFVSGVDFDGAVGSTEFIVMRSKCLNPYMVYLLARTNDFRKNAINSMTGSDGRQRAQVDKIAAFPYLAPSNEIVELFGKHAAPIFEQIQQKNKMCQRLAQARDRLLPKLMSGEIEV